MPWHASDDLREIGGFTLWLCQNSYGKWPFIVSFPIKNGWIFHSYGTVYQRVSQKWRFNRSFWLLQHLHSRRTSMARGFSSHVCDDTVAAVAGRKTTVFRPRCPVCSLPQELIYLGNSPNGGRFVHPLFSQEIIYTTKLNCKDGFSEHDGS